MRATSSTRGRTRRWTWAAASAVALTSVASVAPVSAAYADPGIGTNLGQVILTAAQVVQEAAPPTGAQFARIQAQGGAGGGGFGLTGASTAPGHGMNLVGYLAVEPGDPLEVAVGQQGQLTPSNQGIGGWGNGMDGGDGFVALCTTQPAWMSFSGAGGGATSIEVDGTTVLVAGGGGGGAGGNSLCNSATDAVNNGGAGGDAGPTPQDGQPGIAHDQLPLVLGGKAGAATTGVGESSGATKNGNGPGGAGGGGVLGGGSGLGSPSTSAGLHGGGGGGAGTSMTAGMVGVVPSAGLDASDGFVSITWYSDVALGFSGAPSTTSAGVSTQFDVVLTDPDGQRVDAADHISLATSDPSDTIAGGNITFGHVGPRTVTATFGTATAITELTVVPGAPTAMSVGVPAFAYAGDTITPTVTLVDAEGNDVGPASNVELFSDSAGDTVNADGTITLQPGVSRTATITGQTVLEGTKVVRAQAQLLVTTDWAYKTKVTASSSLEAFGFGAQQLTDGQTASSAGHHGFTTDPAVSTQDSDAWVAVDLGTTRAIGGVVVSPRTAVAPEPANGIDGAGYPQDFTIDVSNDGTTWTTVATYTGQTGMSGPHTYRFTQPASGRYLRLNATLLGPFAEGDDGFRLQLAGLQVYADPAYPAPTSLDIAVDQEGWVTVGGVDAYGVPTGQMLTCDATLTSSNPGDTILAPAYCGGPFGISTPTAGPRTLTATLTADPSVTGAVVYDAGSGGVQLAVRADPMEYGTPAVVHVVNRTSADADGKVEVREASRLLASGTLVAGKADLALDGKALKPGRHNLTVRYLGSRTHHVTSAVIHVVVAKATTSLTATLASPKVTVGSTKAQITVAATSLAGPPSGTVQAVVAGRVVAKAALSKGRATLVLGRFRKAGAATVSVRYLGTATHGPAAVPVRVVVGKASSVVHARVSKVRLSGSQASTTLSTRVTSPVGTPTGRVEVLSRSRVVATGTLRHGELRLGLRLASRTGLRELEVRYLGDRINAPSAATVLVTT